MFGERARRAHRIAFRRMVRLRHHFIYSGSWWLVDVSRGDLLEPGFHRKFNGAHGRCGVCRIPRYKDKGWKKRVVKSLRGMEDFHA